MSVPENHEFNFNFGKIDWDEYESHRPPYPKALYQLIYDHHQANGGQWDTALDVGAGGGIVTKQLLNQFSHVVFSDIGAGYIAQAQARFAKEAEAGRISFLQRKFNEFHPSADFPHGDQVDMLTAGTCIHFCDSAETIMSQFADLVRPGGTVAIFTYMVRAVLPPGDPASGPLDACLDKMMHHIHENVMRLDDKAPSAFFQSRYDIIEFDPAVWKNVRRITSLPEVPFVDFASGGTSRFKPEVESKESLPDDYISIPVDYTFLEKLFINYYPGFPLLDWIKVELQQLKVALGSRRVVAKWPIILVLATRK